VHLRELTHRNRDGVPYRRDDAVDTQIERALALAPTPLIAQAGVRDYRSPAFLQEECLVYLIREYRSRGDTATVEALCEALLARCARHINGKLQALGPQAVDDAFGEVVLKVFDQILNLESDGGDFLQVRFWVALERIAITTFGRHVKELTRATRQVSLSALPGSSDGDDERRSPSIGLDELPDLTTNMDQAMLYQEGLAALDEPYRTVFVLRYYEGWPIEDRDPAVPTISRHFNKTPRTIRNWMRDAERALAVWRGDEQ
jgi:DNA-directed RNA polymerase specialized sigma24 family protein